MKGMRFIVVLAPCLAGWGIPEDAAVRVSRLAVETGMFPLYEIEAGERYTINHGRTGRPVKEYLEAQARYRHLTADQVAELQAGVDHQWAMLQARSQLNRDPTPAR